MDDYAPQQTSDQTIWSSRTTLDGGNNKWEWVNGNEFKFSKVTGGVDVSAYLSSWQIGDSLEFYLPNGIKKRFYRKITAIDSTGMTDPAINGLGVTFTGSAIPETEFSAIHVINVDRPVNPVDVDLVATAVPVWDGNNFRGKPLLIGELGDVYGYADYVDNDINKPYKTVTIAGLGNLRFNSYTVPTDERWSTYANLTYGPTFGKYHLSPEDGGTITNEAARDAEARRTYYGTEGILHNLGDKPLWLNGRLGSQYSNETPELRWTSGDPQQYANNQNYIGLKLPANLTVSTTYTFPSEAYSGGYLTTDADGNLTWDTNVSTSDPVSTGVVMTPQFVFNYEASGGDTVTVPLGYISSANPKIGVSSLDINDSQSDAQTITGSWPGSPYGDTNFIGTRAFTFQTWFKNENPELPTGLTRYHRVISTAAGSANVAGGFQVRTHGGTTDGDGPQGALELSADEIIIRGDTVVTDSNWHHLVIQHYGNGSYAMFLDGVLDKFVERTGGAYEFTDSNGFIIGGRSDNAANTFWQGGLDATEILVGAALYSQDGFTPPTSPAGQEAVIVPNTIARPSTLADMGDVIHYGSADVDEIHAWNSELVAQVTGGVTDYPDSQGNGPLTRT